jgi:hypothetical protein
MTALFILLCSWPPLLFLGYVALILLGLVASAFGANTGCGCVAIGVLVLVAIAL